MNDMHLNSFIVVINKVPHYVHKFTTKMPFEKKNGTFVCLILIELKKHLYE